MTIGLSLTDGAFVHGPQFVKLRTCLKRVQSNTGSRNLTDLRQHGSVIKEKPCITNQSESILMCPTR
jgi:hypothetical protein